MTLPVVLTVLDVDPLDAPGNFRFFKGVSFGRLALILVILNGDIAPRIVVFFALVVGISMITLSSFLTKTLFFSD